MGAGELPRQWNKRLSMLSAKMVSLGLAMAVVLAGLAFYIASNSRQTLWLVGAFFVALWLGLHGGPWLIRLAEQAGMFGRVKIDGGRLLLNHGESIELEKPLAVEARYQHSTITRVYDMRSLTGSGTRRDRKYQLSVTVLTMFIEQDGRCVVLAADEKSRRRGRKYSLEGLNIRKVGIGFPKGPPGVRLWPADLAEILGVLQNAKGYSTALSPVPDKALEDPRRAICPIWKTAGGAAIVLVASLALAIGIITFFS